MTTFFSDKCSICHILFLLNTYPPPPTLPFLSIILPPHRSPSKFSLTLNSIPSSAPLINLCPRRPHQKYRKGREGPWVLESSRDVLHQLFSIWLLVKACRPQPQVPLLESRATRKETDSSYMEPDLSALLASWDSAVKYRQFQVQKYL